MSATGSAYQSLTKLFAPEGASNNLLRGRMAALRGARRLAYLHDMSRLLRSGRLALQPLATVVRGAFLPAEGSRFPSPGPRAIQ